MKVIIVDDEHSVRESLFSMLKNNHPDIEIAATAGTIREAYEAIARSQPDLLFLDVELPDGLGFELLEKLPGINFKIIFITGHQEYAMNAIKVSALDFLLKPIDEDELSEAIEKARKAIDKEDEQLKYKALTENLQHKTILKRIILRTSESLILVSISDIVRAEADSNYTHFHLAGNKHVLVSGSLKEYCSMLSGSGFIRTHQSHIVNCDYIDRFVKKEGGFLILKNGNSIPVSPKLKKEVLDRIERLQFG